jgi:peptide/nickel transport system substrate-binding protein
MRSGRRQLGARAIVTAGAALVLAAALAACGGGSASSQASGSNKTLVVSTGASGNFVDNFNPFSPNYLAPTKGMIYEPLYFFDTADAAQKSPWLAASYSFSNGGKTLAFNLRTGVKWSDGTPFTSTDVAFTFNLIKDTAGLNAYGLPITSATAEGPDKVVLTFSAPVYTDIYYIAGQTYMLPAHIWKAVKDPGTFLNQHPVGTGAYEVSKVSGTVMDVTANPHYYMPGLPKFKIVQFLSFDGNTSSDLAIEEGQVDWAGNYIPQITKNYLNKSSKYALTDIPLGLEFLVTNDKTGPTASVAVRKAISYAIDRSLISDQVYQGYASPTNPEALLTPNFSSVMDPSLKGETLAYSVADAKQTLETAGYKLGSNGIFVSPAGQPLNLSVQVINGYTDYVQALQLLVPELRQAGINLSIDAESSTEFASNLETGNFQSAIYPLGYTSSPYTYYNDLIGGSYAPAIGKVDAVGDFGRYNNPTVNAALAVIAASSSTPSVLSDYYTIEQQFIKDMPLIPLFDQQDEQEFNTSVVTGYPTTSNPYAADSWGMSPDIGWAADRVAPAS